MFNNNTKLKGNGLGKLYNRELTVTEKGLNIVKEHLKLFDEYLPNKQMVQRLEEAMKSGIKIKNADAIFYTHELKESTLMKNLLKDNDIIDTTSKEFIDIYNMAHEEALKFYEVSPFSVYHKDVILNNKEEFSSVWFKFWESIE